MPFHFCTDELNILLCSIPFIGIGVHFLRAKLSTRRAHKCDAVLVNGCYYTVENDPRIR